jgi:hypothetical protein
VISPDVPLVNSTTPLESELWFSPLILAPFVAQLQRICLLPSHLPEVSGKTLIKSDKTEGLNVINYKIK